MVTSIAEPWRGYGSQEPGVDEFISKFSGTSMAIMSIDITADGALDNERSLTDYGALWSLLTDPQPTPLRVLLVNELSAEALQILSTTLNIHLGFWSWITSNDASDGFWLNTHDDGRVLSFDLPGLEFYTASTSFTSGVVREGRLKHLSSRHCLYGSEKDSEKAYETYVNRRVSGYLVPMNSPTVHTFILFSEDCQQVSSMTLDNSPLTDPISTGWFLRKLRDADPATRLKYKDEPLGLIIEVVTKLLRSWHVFTVRVQRDLEKIDGSLPESLPTKLPEHNLYDVGTYLHRDIVQTLYRFNQQLGKFGGYLSYIGTGTRQHFRPKLFERDIANLNNNVRDLRSRLDSCKDRGNGSLSLIHNYISLQQARLANEQARISAQAAIIQQNDSRSTMRLSVVATVFLPLSFASSWLSATNPHLWVFFAAAVPSILATTVIIYLLKFLEKWKGWRDVEAGVIPGSQSEININPELLV